MASRRFPASVLTHVALAVLAILVACGDDSTPQGGDAGGGAANGESGATATGGNGSGTGGKSPFGTGTGGFGALADGGGACATDTLTSESEGRPADIIIAIDQSTSMTEETQFVQMQINAFAAQITAMDIDARIVLIAENPSGPVGENLICVPEPLAGPMCGDNPDKSFMNVNHHVDSHDAFAWILDCYAGGNAHESCYDSESVPFDCQFMYQTVLRDDAVKHVVVITDDDPCMTGMEFDQAFTALDPMHHGDYLFHAIVPFTDCPYRSGAPDEYLALVTDRVGVSGDLCTQDFQPVWDKLVATVAKTSVLACEWDIPAVPSNETLDPNKVNVSYTLDGKARDLKHVPAEADCAKAQDAWYYDDPKNPTQILVCPDVCDEIQAAGAGKQRIDVLVGCETVMFPLL